MTTINKLSALDVLRSGDQFPVYSPTNGDARRTSLGKILEFIVANAQFTVQEELDEKVSQFVPNLLQTDESFTYAFPSDTDNHFLILQALVGIPEATLRLPNPSLIKDMQEVMVAVDSGFVSLLSFDTQGATVINAPTQLVTGSYLRLKYLAESNSWYVIADNKEFTASTATGISFDDVIAQLGVTNVQDAIDVLAVKKVDQEVIDQTVVGIGVYTSHLRKEWVKGFAAFTGAIGIEITGLYTETLMSGRMKLTIHQPNVSDRVLYLDGRWRASLQAWDYADVTEVSSSTSPVNVRFAKDSLNQRVWLLVGETTTDWANVRLSIDDVMSNYNDDMDYGFAFSQITSLTGIDVDYTIRTKSTNTVIEYREFHKDDKFDNLFEFTGGDVLTKQQVVLNVNDEKVTIASGTEVTLPVLASHTDYKIFCDESGNLSAHPWDLADPVNSRWIGGFHSSHTTATVTTRSLWDLTWRPSCSPRGMTLSPDNKVWVDIYKMDVDYGIDGYSKGDATIADGGSLPKKPLIYGGDGTTTYAGMTWYNSWDLAIAAGKRLPFYGEFTGFAYGVVEAQSVGTDPATTKYQAGHRSACGVEQATGALYDWGADIQGNIAGGWVAITDGRGSVYHSGISAVVLGGAWAEASASGSRCSIWNVSPSNSFTAISARAVCDHQIL